MGEVPFTFECGVCHAVYRLEEQQITAVGVKITCPKCLNYFFLKRGGTEPAGTPVVEYVVPDGAYDVSEKAEEKPVKPKSPPPPRREIPTNAGFLAPAEKTQITAADLSDLPPDPPPSTAFDQYVMLGAGIVIVAVALLYLNFTGALTIPGLEKLRRKSEITQPVPPPAMSTPSDRKTPKYGFPQMDPNYDPWTGKTMEAAKPEVTPPAE